MLSDQEMKELMDRAYSSWKFLKEAKGNPFMSPETRDSADKRLMLLAESIQDWLKFPSPMPQSAQGDQ